MNTGISKHRLILGILYAKVVKPRHAALERNRYRVAYY